MSENKFLVTQTTMKCMNFCSSKKTSQRILTTAFSLALLTFGANALGSEQVCSTLGRTSADYIAKAMQSEKVAFLNISSVSKNGNAIFVSASRHGQLVTIQLTVNQQCDGSLAIEGEEAQ
jgi:hypothetical protein